VCTELLGQSRGVAPTEAYHAGLVRFLSTRGLRLGSEPAVWVCVERFEHDVEHGVEHDVGDPVVGDPVVAWRASRFAAALDAPAPLRGSNGEACWARCEMAEVPRAVLRVVCAVGAGSIRAEPRRREADPPSPPSGPSRVAGRVSSAPRCVRSFPTRRAVTRRDHSKFSFYAIFLFSPPYSCEQVNRKLPRRDVLPEEKSGVSEDLFNPRHRSSLTTIHHG